MLLSQSAAKNERLAHIRAQRESQALDAPDHALQGVGGADLPKRAVVAGLGDSEGVTAAEEGEREGIVVAGLGDGERVSAAEEGEQPVVLVTGAARGIGAAVVSALACQGWRVIALDACEDGPDTGHAKPSRHDLEEVAARAGQGVEAVQVDVRDESALSAAAASAVARHGRLDAAVAAAGVLIGGKPLWETDPDEWQAVIETDLTGVWHTIKATIPHVLRSPGPRRFVAVASAAGSLGLSRLGAYAAAKHGTVGLVRSLSVDLAQTGATANIVAPGSTSGVMLEASADVYGLASAEEFVVHQRPLGRLIAPAEVAAAVAWLCSSDTPALTGAVIAVDGGMTASI